MYCFLLFFRQPMWWHHILWTRGCVCRPLQQLEVVFPAWKEIRSDGCYPFKFCHSRLGALFQTGKAILGIRSHQKVQPIRKHCLFVCLFIGRRTVRSNWSCNPFLKRSILFRDVASPCLKFCHSLLGALIQTGKAILGLKSHLKETPIRNYRSCSSLES